MCPNVSEKHAVLHNQYTTLSPSLSLTISLSPSPSLSLTILSLAPILPNILPSYVPMYVCGYILGWFAPRAPRLGTNPWTALLGVDTFQQNFWLYVNGLILKHRYES